MEVNVHSCRSELILYSVEDCLVMSFTSEFLRAQSTFGTQLVRLSAAQGMNHWLVLLPEGLAHEVLGCKVTIGQPNLFDVG